MGALHSVRAPVGDSFPDIPMVFRTPSVRRGRQTLQFKELSYNEEGIGAPSAP